MVRRPTTVSAIKKDKQDQIEYYRFNKLTGELYKQNKEQAHKKQLENTTLDQAHNTIERFTSRIKNSYHPVIEPQKNHPLHDQICSFLYKN
ncbi:MAG: hypothetical protein ACLFTH_00240 [Candidatus Woesearchaeota archaeon]